MNTKNNVVKLHPEIMHLMPVVPSRKRVKGYEITRKWGAVKLTATAPESLNHHDLITLGFLARAHQRGQYEAAEPSSDGKERVKVVLDVTEVVKERGLHNKMPNRRSFINSVVRWHHTHLKIEDADRVRHTWLVSDVEYDKQFKHVEVYANKAWLDWCIRNGIIVHLQRLVKYRDHGVAVLVDAWLQSTKQRTGKGYAFRDKVSEEELFALIDPYGKKQNHHLRQELKEAFVLLEQAGLPPYVYDRVTRSWFRADFLANREI